VQLLRTCGKIDLFFELWTDVYLRFQVRPSTLVQRSPVSVVISNTGMSEMTGGEVGLRIEVVDVATVTVSVAEPTVSARFNLLC